MFKQQQKKQSNKFNIIQTLKDRKKQNKIDTIRNSRQE